MKTWRWVGVFVATGLVAGAQAGAGQALRPDLAGVAAESGWTLSNRGAVTWREGGRVGATLDAGAGHGIAWVEGSDFDKGTLEVSVRGSNTPGRSFVGLAFHGVDHETFDAVYLRPFNFRADNAASRSHAVQYVSHPDNPWQKLRQETPGAYEASLDPAPDPDAFVRLRIVLAGDRVRVFVDGAPTPSLDVVGLSRRPGGRVGLWVGNGSDGTFSDLVIRPAG